MWIALKTRAKAPTSLSATNYEEAWEEQVYVENPGGEGSGGHMETVHHPEVYGTITVTGVLGDSTVWECRISGSTGTWHTGASGGIGGLLDGTYEVRAKGNDSAYAGATKTVTVGITYAPSPGDGSG